MTSIESKPTHSATATRSTLELRGLNKTFSPTVIPVKNLDLSVDRGEFLTLLGPSGCGKSTVLRMIAGLEQPTRGQVLLEGKDVTRLGPGDRNMSMVFQSYALYPHMTVAENIASGLKLRKVPRHEIEERIQEVGNFLGLQPLLNRRPSQLSGGQRQRVAVARALVRRPSVFLLDEPLSNLDALLRENVRAELKQLFEHQQAPVVYVTHDQTEAMTLSTKVAILSEGHLQQLDTPHRIYTHPANRFVAGFVGSPQMNFLMLPCEGQTAILGHSRIPLPRAVPPSTRRIVLGIRPEHVQVAQGDRATVSGEIFLVENLGMHNLVSVRVPDIEGQPTLRLLLTPDRHPTGQQLHLTFPPQDMHWFDAETGDALRD
ncbi:MULTISPECIES: ABC transporter ATP-binding protein [unclassified Leptolyngbya]|uniref:ABC transporter ATP-binding protein n=1 Tax=unclassified Leptolyngbya TaxID=2650499 RepID=UPI001688B4F6|nr:MULTISPECIES: ABC transporter ATP-binding protein [unclassified Leptolyngbya]MBD1909517.1 ABC transporter ATP-binding protein [Leptolyngbya sp. FACHB-8]MBD2158998.1 ABC transporter ATP-binding protein [Leptolyngbya sp. FACHB-16]